MRDASCVTVLSLPPRRSDEPSQPGYGPSCCLRLSVAGSTSECPHFRGHIRDRLRYGPVTCCHPEDGLVDGLQRLGFPPPCHPSYKALAFTLAGLTPAERVRLRWTHNRAGGSPASGSPVGSCVSYTEHPGNRAQQVILRKWHDFRPATRGAFSGPPSLLTPRRPRALKGHGSFTWACDAVGFSGHHSG